MSTTGKRIRERRMELGLSQVQLAERTGYKSDVSICRIESGLQDCPKNKLQSFADALYTTPGYLAGWDEKTSNPILNENERYLEMLHKDPQFRILLDSSAKLDEKSLTKLIDFVKSLSD